MLDKYKETHVSRSIYVDKKLYEEFELIAKKKNKKPSVLIVELMAAFVKGVKDASKRNS